MYLMTHFTETIKTALTASIAAFFVILLISFISLNTSYGYIIAVSFGATMVLLFGYPSSRFAQPKNIFFGHLITAISGILFTYVSVTLFIVIALSVSLGIFFMIVFDVVHPPAGGNPIAICIGNYNYDFIFTTILIGTIIIILLGLFINRYILKIKYPVE